MQEKARYKIPIPQGQKVRSLCWVNHYLIDYANVCTRYYLNGQVKQGSVNYAYRFDSAIATSDGQFVVLYERYGTKGILLKEGQILREINRSFYCANSYEYPVVLFTSQDKKVCIAHCPEHYNIIEIEDAETGERLTEKGRDLGDFFQSRLQVSPNQKWLLSAGWIWHPLDSVQIFDISSNLLNPPLYSPFWDGNLGGIGLWEVDNAAFIDDSKIIFSGTGNAEDEDESKENSIVIFDLIGKRIISRASITKPTGRLMVLNENFAIGFYDFPKLINLTSGEIVNQWADIVCDKQNSSIRYPDDSSYIALDPKKKRFAVAMTDRIEVIVFE